MHLEFLLVVLVFFPMAGSFLALATGHKPLLCRWLSLCVTLIELAMVSLLFVVSLTPQTGPTGAWLLVEDYPWLPGLGARFNLALDGLNLLLIWLTAFVNVICILISWRAIYFQDRLLPFLSAVPGKLPDGPLYDRGPPALLPLLGDPAHPHVLPDRHLGARQPGLRRHQVRALHLRGAACSCSSPWWPFTSSMASRPASTPSPSIS